MRERYTATRTEYRREGKKPLGVNKKKSYLLNQTGAVAVFYSRAVLAVAPMVMCVLCTVYRPKGYCVCVSVCMCECV